MIELMGALVILGIDILLKEKIGYGTIIDALLVGLGTIIGTFGAGLVMQLVYMIIRFEPRKLQHRGVVEISKLLVTGKA